VHARGLVSAIKRSNVKNASKQARLVIKNLSRK
jgi:hypothetical protein